MISRQDYLDNPVVLFIRREPQVPRGLNNKVDFDPAAYPLSRLDVTDVPKIRLSYFNLTITQSWS